VDLHLIAKKPLSVIDSSVTFVSAHEDIEIDSGLKSLMIEIKSNRQLALGRMAASALDMDVHVLRSALEEFKFILTQDIVYRLRLIHERRLLGTSFIMMGGTGVGKSYLFEFYAHATNLPYHRWLQFLVRPDKLYSGTDLRSIPTDHSNI